MSPLKRFTNLIIWIKFRRMLGLFVFFYATIHLITYVVIDYRFDWQQIFNDVLKKKYIFIGFSAWLLLIPLSSYIITKNDKFVKDIIGKNYIELIYIIAIFGALHYIWLSKTIFFKPLIFTADYTCFTNALRIKIKKKERQTMDDKIKKEIQSATFERLLSHLDERKDVQNIDLMNLANFCRNCLSRWYREEAEKKGA